MHSLLPAPPPRWRGVVIALAALALFLGAAITIWSLQEDERPTTAMGREAK